MKTIFTIILGIVTIAYPFMIYFGSGKVEPKYFGIILLVLLLSRAVKYRRAIIANRNQFIPIVIAFAVNVAFILFFNKEKYLLIVPSFVDATFFIVFVHTLFRPPTMIERFARLSRPDLPESAIPYCRKVTIVWSLFFVFTGLVSLWTALYRSLADWTLYNGVISNILMGVLFCGEYLIRRKKEKKFEEGFGPTT